MYHLHTRCRACGFGQEVTPAGIKIGETNQKLVPVFDLGIQPLANDFRSEAEEHEGFAPLKVLFCPRCTLAQLSVTVRPDILYSHYSYVTSRSPMMRDHFEALRKQIATLGGNRRVLEIGSNDGTLLEYLRTHGHDQVFGIDPAENLSIKANQIGIPTMCEMFNLSSAKAWRKEVGTAGVILARHVFCHINNWQDFVQGLEAVSDKHTLIGIEVPHAEKMLRGVEYDTIYFEHTSYFTVRAMEALLRQSDFHIHEVTDYPVHGGSLMVWLRHNESGIPPTANVQSRLEHERAGMGQWVDFSTKSHENISKLKTLVKGLRSKHKRVVGFGASAKSTVAINACGFTRQDIEYVTDTTPEKMYKLVPGTDIPIFDQGALLRDLPDYAVCWAWNFLTDVLTGQKAYLNNGGKFILPVPEVKVIP